MKFEKHKSAIPWIARELQLPKISENWNGVDCILPIINVIQQEKSIFIIKIDGARTSVEDNGPYTVVISGEILNDDSIRIDALKLEEALSYAIVKYAQKVWNIKVAIE